VSASDTITRFFVLSVPSGGVVVRLPPPGGARFARLPYGTASNGMTTSTRHHVSFGCFRLIYMMFLSTLNKRTIDVINIMIMLFFWIKLNLKLPIFLTIQKRDR
jgi:hypothetical protein